MHQSQTYLIIFCLFLGDLFHTKFDIYKGI